MFRYMSPKAESQPVQLNAATLWYSFNPQYNKPINADRWRRRASQPGRAAAGYL